MKTEDRIQLDQLDKKLPFSTPNNYFEQFEANISSQLNMPVAKQVSFYQHYKIIIYAAAIFLMLVAIGLPLYQKMQHSKDMLVDEEFKTYVASEVEEEELVEYVASIDTE